MPEAGFGTAWIARSPSLDAPRRQAWARATAEQWVAAPSVAGATLAGHSEGAVAAPIVRVQAAQEALQSRFRTGGGHEQAAVEARAQGGAQGSVDSPLSAAFRSPGGTDILEDARAFPWKAGPHTDRAEPARWRSATQDGDLRGPIPPPPPYVPPYPCIVEPQFVGFEPLPHPCVVDYTQVPAASYVGRTLDSGGIVRWARPDPQQDRGLRAPWDRRKAHIFGGGQSGVEGPGDELPWDPSPVTVYFPIRWSYAVHNTVSLTLLPEGLESTITALSAKFPRESAAATLSATIEGPGWRDLLELQDGEPRIVRMDVNGHVRDFVVDAWEEAQSFNSTTLSLTARSLPFLLGERFWLPTSGVQGAERTMAQLAQEAVTDAGWTVVWNAQDWLVPGGVHSWVDQTPLAILGRLAVAAGAWLDSHPTETTVYVRPVYPTAPWDFATALPDFVVDRGLLQSVRRTARFPDQANRIYVAGAETGGVLVQATRTGTDGALEAPMVVDPYITHSDGGQDRAVRELARFANQGQITGATLAFDNDDFSLLTPGSLVELQMPGAFRGIVASLSLSVSRSGRGGIEVWQSVEFGEGGQNQFSVLRNLLARESMRIATVDTGGVKSDGTLQVVFPGGGEARVRAFGGEAEGDNVWVRGREAQGAAPDLGAPIVITV